MVTIDKTSPPGSWKTEMERMPWRFGDDHMKTVNAALAELRLHGYSTQANLLAQEISSLRAEISRLTLKVSNYDSR